MPNRDAEAGNAAWGGFGSGMRRNAFQIVAVCALVFIMDQATKWLILNLVMVPPRIIGVTSFFSLRLGFNSGISFGLFSDFFESNPLVLAAIKLLVAGGLLIWVFQTSMRFERLGLSMIAGGALGNMLDRYRQGAVTDFLDFYWNGWHYPTFNMADVFITIGAGMLMLASLRGTGKPGTT